MYVSCSYVLEHLSRISRVLKQPGGNALLVGVGGSGRQSITRLATSMAHMTMFQPEISKSYGMTEWRDDLKVSVMVYNRLLVILMHYMYFPQTILISVCNAFDFQTDVPNFNIVTIPCFSLYYRCC